MVGRRSWLGGARGWAALVVGRRSWLGGARGWALSAPEADFRIIPIEKIEGTWNIRTTLEHNQKRMEHRNPGVAPRSLDFDICSHVKFS